MNLCTRDKREDTSRPLVRSIILATNFTDEN